MIELVKNKQSYYQAVFEYVGGGDLMAHYVNLPRQDQSIAAVKTYFRKILEIMRFCHDNGIHHGKVCPENLLFVSSHGESPLKLVDFCSAQVIKQHCLSTRVGVTCYMSPEFLKKQVVQAESDMWSCGIIFFQLLTGRLPFDKPVLNDLKKGVIYFSEAEQEDIPFSAKELANSLLVFNPEGRLSAAAALQHPFFTQPEDILPLAISH